MSIRIWPSNLMFNLAAGRKANFQDLLAGSLYQATSPSVDLCLFCPTGSPFQTVQYILLNPSLTTKLMLAK